MCGNRRRWHRLPAGEAKTAGWLCASPKYRVAIHAAWLTRREHPRGPARGGCGVDIGGSDEP